MCNCGKNKPKKPPTSGTMSSQSFALIRDGVRTEYGSKLEAEAENVRAGGGGTIQPV